MKSSGELLRHPGSSSGYPHAAGDAPGAAGMCQIKRGGDRRPQPPGNWTISCAGQRSTRNIFTMLQLTYYDCKHEVDIIVKKKHIWKMLSNYI